MAIEIAETTFESRAEMRARRGVELLTDARREWALTIELGERAYNLLDTESAGFSWLQMVRYNVANGYWKGVISTRR